MNFRTSPGLPLLLVNQSIGSLFSDVVAAAAKLTSVVVFRGMPYRRIPATARMMTWLGFSVQLAWHLIVRGHNYNSLLVVSNPPFAPLLAALARRPYVLLLYDIYPQILAQIKTSHPFQRFALDQLINLWEAANRYSFAKAKRILTLSPSMAQQLRPFFESEILWQQRVLVIPPWADTTNMRPSPCAAQIFRLKYGVEGFLLTYSGNLGLTHPLEPLLEACALFEELFHPPLVQMLLIGDGPKRIQLEERAHALRLPTNRIRFLDPLPYSELPASLSAATLAVVALDGPASNASLPSKTFNALACGTPLLALTPADSALALLVHQHQCGVVIEPGPEASQKLLEVIIHLAENSDELRQLAMNALSASRHYTPRNAKRVIDAWLGP